MDKEEAAILRRHQALPSGEQEMRAGLAMFLAQVEGSATVTAAHVAAAADIADGNALAAGPDFTAESSVQVQDPAVTALPPAGRSRGWRVIGQVACVLAACVLVAGLALALLPGTFDKAGAPASGHETGTPSPVKAPSKAEPLRPPDTAFAAQIPAAAQAPSVRTQPAPIRHAPLLATVPAHVSVSYQRGSESALQRAVQLVRSLRAQGLDAADPEPAADVPRPRIGYFFAEDSGSARTMAHTLAGIDPAWEGARTSQMPAPSGALPPPGSIVLAVPTSRSDPGRHA